jgi:hypothetical protein
MESADSYVHKGFYREVFGVVVSEIRNSWEKAVAPAKERSRTEKTALVAKQN